MNQPLLLGEHKLSCFGNLNKNRIYLSPMDFSFTNRELYKLWFSDPMIRTQMGFIGDRLSDNDIDRWKSQYNKLNQKLFNIVLRSNDCVIGMCSVTTGVSDIEGEIEILIGQRNNRNKGYGTEAIRLLLSFCKTELHLRKLVIRVLARNIPAIKCYEKVGFVIREEMSCKQDDSVVLMERII